MKSKRNKIFSAAAIFVLALCLIVLRKPAGSLKLIEESSTPLETAYVSEPAATVWRRIDASFPYDKEKAKKIYPDEYGGMYIDGEWLCLCLKNFDEESIDHYKSLAGAKAEYIRIVPVTYSYDELDAFRDELISILAEQELVWYMAGIDESKNGLHLTTSAECAERLREIAEEKLPNVCVTVEVGFPAYYTAQLEFSPSAA